MHTHTNAPSCTLICLLNCRHSWLAKHQTTPYLTNLSIYLSIIPFYLSLYLSTYGVLHTHIRDYVPAIPNFPFSLPLYFPSQNFTDLLVSLLYLLTYLHTYTPAYLPTLLNTSLPISILLYLLSQQCTTYFTYLPLLSFRPTHFTTYLLL